MNDLQIIDNKIEFRKTNLSNNTLRNYTQKVKSFLTYCQENNLDVNNKTVIDFFNNIQQTYAANTFNSYKIALKEFLAKRFENDSANYNLVIETFKQIKNRKPERRLNPDKHFTNLEYIKLCQALTKRMSLIVQGLYVMGCRVSECFNIQLTNCKIENGIVIIKIFNGKCGKDNTCYLPIGLYNSIIETFKGSKYLFETRNGKPLVSNGYYNELKRQANKVGITNVYFHKLRSSRLHDLYFDKHISIEQISEFANHSSIETTKRYIGTIKPSIDSLGIKDYKII